MKNRKIILGMSLLASALLVNNGYANEVTPKIQLTTTTQTTKATVGTANTFEREVTPLLREISKKRSALDIRKLDRELEKLDEDAAKAQSEKEKAALTLQITAQNAATSAATAVAAAKPVTASMTSALPSPAVRVLMIYGYEQDLYAKILVGKEGGYPVKKGDILPDGRIVTGITPSYVEVASGRGKKARTERLIAMGASDLANGTDTQVNGGTPNASSVNSAPIQLTPSSAIPSAGPSPMLILPQAVPGR